MQALQDDRRAGDRNISGSDHPTATLHGRDDLNNIHTNIPAILREISDRQLVLCGDPVTRMICSLDTGKGMERFDEAWFPIEPARE